MIEYKPPFPIPVIHNAPRADSRHYRAWAEYRKWKPWVPALRPITDIVVHSTMGTHSLRWLTVDPASEVSAHALCNADGSRNNLVDLIDIAYHAGTCCCHLSNLNTLGVEIENPSDESKGLRVPYPQIQIIAAAYTVAEWMFSYGMDWDRVRRHGDIATPTGRRADPINFDWAIFQAVTNQWRDFFNRLPISLHGAYIL